MTEYWTISHGLAIRTGWSCRECKSVIFRGEEITVRDGRKMRLFYHSACFSGDADPRTQQGSSFFDPRFPSSSFNPTAPSSKGHGKWAVVDYGYRPVPLPTSMPISSPHLSLSELSKSINNIDTSFRQRMRQKSGREKNEKNLENDKRDSGHEQETMLDYEDEEELDEFDGELGSPKSIVRNRRERSNSLDGENVSVVGQDKIVMIGERNAHANPRASTLGRNSTVSGSSRSSSVPPKSLSDAVTNTAARKGKEIVWGFQNKESEKAKLIRKEMDDKLMEKVRAKELKEEERKRRIEMKSSQEAVTIAAEKAAEKAKSITSTSAVKPKSPTRSPMLNTPIRSPSLSPKPLRPAFR
ncbi:hypothetical protein HK098_005661 [Nowakowskiella sp. JEL0407]|nr:hypothetical protein HK098_005661 [Nowakowskiella sp. JEL0407]